MAEDAKMAADDAMMSMEETGGRLAQVQDRGHVICASRNDVPGYGSLDDSGRNVGFDIDLCRALATAVLGDPEAIEIQYITAAERGPTIQSGEVDMLVRTVTWTTSRGRTVGQLRSDHVLRRTGLHGPGRPRCDIRIRTRRRRRLCNQRYYYRAQHG